MIDLERPARARHWDVYGTGDLSFVFEVSPGTAAKWMDSNRIGGAHRVGLYRRVTRRGLIQFIEATCPDEGLREHRFKRLAIVDERRRTKRSIT